MVRILRQGVLLLALGLVLGSCMTTRPVPPEERLALIYPEDRPFAESRFTTTSGLTLHYRTWAPDGEPEGKVLLLHGVGGSTYSFNDLAPRLAAEGYSVVALDLPGFGYSDSAVRFEHTAPNRLEIIWNFIDRLDTDNNQFNPLARWFIVGHQMGGEFGAWMATDRPGRVGGLALMGTIIGENRPGGSWAGFPPVRWAFRSWFNSNLATPEGVHELLEKAYAQPPTAEAVDGYLAPVVRPDADRAIVNFTKTVGAEVPDLAQVQAPLLFIWGEDDSWRPLEDARLQAEAVPGSSLVVIPNAGHLPTDTHARHTTRVLTEWFAAIASGAQSPLPQP